LFWKDPWLDGVSLDVRYAKLFDLLINKCATIAEVFSLGWEVNGEAWKWKRRLFVWEVGLVRECAKQLSLVVLQVSVSDRWIWKLHSSHVHDKKCL